MPKIMKTLNNISRCQAIYRKRKVKSDGLCTHHYAFVLAICHNRGASQEDIAKILCLDKSTVARSLAYLQENEYITRTPNQTDKRQYLVYPTEKMLEVYPKIRLANEEWNSRIRQGITNDELEIFYRVLFKMEEGAKKVLAETEDDE